MKRALFTDCEVGVGRCESDSAHFRGAARELYTYLRLLANNHNGFIYAHTADITRHLKRKFHDDAHFSERECERLLRIFRVLGVISEWRQEYLGGRLREGRRLFPHSEWAVLEDGWCNLIYRDELDANADQLWRETRVRTAEQTAVPTAAQTAD